MPSAFTGKTGLVLHPRSWARFADRLVVVVSARELAGLAGGPDAAIRLDSTRGYLADSAENRRMADMLRKDSQQNNMRALSALTCEVKSQNPQVNSLRALTGPGTSEP